MLAEGFPNPCAPAGFRSRGICLARSRRSRLSIFIFSSAEYSVCRAVWNSMVGLKLYAFSDRIIVPQVSNAERIRNIG